MKTPTCLICYGLLAAGSGTSAMAGEDGAGYEYVTISRVYGTTDDASKLGYLLSPEADYEGGKSGLADVNPDGIDFRVQGYTGFHSNPAHEIKGFTNDSWFGGIRASAAHRIENGPLDVYWGASLRHTVYERDIINRERGDASGSDLSARVGIHYAIAPFVAIGTFTRFDHLAHLDFAHGALRYGLQQDDVLRFESRNFIHWRYDGMELGGTGLESKATFDYLEYQGDRFDFWDFNRYRTTFQTSYRTSEWFRFGGFIGYGEKSWRQFDDLDSDSVLYGGFADGRFGCGVGWDFRAGFEHRDYRDRFFRDREEPFVSLKFSGQLTDRTFLYYQGYYGIGDYYQNMGGLNHFDPIVLRNSLSLVNDFGSWTGRMTYCHQYVDPDLRTRGGGWGMALRQELFTLSTGVDVSLANNAKLSAEVGVFRGDHGFGGKDEYEGFHGTLGVTFQF